MKAKDKIKWIQCADKMVIFLEGARKTTRISVKVAERRPLFTRREPPECESETSLGAPSSLVHLKPEELAEILHIYGWGRHIIRMNHRDTLPENGGA
jgi:hypothetical protein